MIVPVKERKTQKSIEIGEQTSFGCVKDGESAKNEARGRGKGEEECLQPSNVNLKYSVHQPVELVIGWASLTLLTCVDERS